MNNVLDHVVCDIVHTIQNLYYYLVLKNQYI